MQLRLALAEEDCQQHAAECQAYASNGARGKLLAKHRPCQQCGDRGIQRKQDSRTARPQPVEAGEEKRVANKNADEAGKKK
ncbi:hypothetical protein D3C72_2013350 [compost metagenome]